MKETRISRLVFSLALTILAAAGSAFGQARSGNIYGRVVAEDGSALPGVSVTLTGFGAPQTFTSDSRGDFRFLNLAPGDSYSMRFDMSGFSAVERKSVAVTLGNNTDVRVAMKLSKVEATVTVSGEAPLLDTRKVGTGAVITRAEMDAIPSARDPWVVMQTVPGVQMDRINVGGNQSGQQAVFMAKGAQTTQGTWNLDGVTVSDMASGASSPTYWDFDSFQELQAVTGGSDPSIATAGVTLNMVTKRGTNDVHGSARTFITDPAFQAKPTFTQEERNQAAAGTTGGNFVGNKITGIQDYGLEIGGPVVKDRVWLWGSYGRQQIDLLTVFGYPDRTTLEDINGKLNVQALDSNAITVFYLRGDKRKQGRNAAVDRPPETTYNQTGPTTLTKIEDNHVFSPSFVADAFYSYMDEGFKLLGTGGTGPQVFQDTNAIWHNSFLQNVFGRPQHQALASANYFFNTGSLGHEIKGGFSYRDAPVRNEAFWPGGEVVAFQGPRPGTSGSGACNVDCAAITRRSNRRVDVKYYSGYLSDTITADRLTMSLGLRYDYQTGAVQTSFAPANPLYPNILPDASAPAREDVIKWKDFSPRVGATYAFGANRRTLARFSYARYANQLGAYPVNQLSAIPGIAYAYYPWTDANGNNRVDPGELDTSSLIKSFNFNPASPGSPTSPHSINPNLKSQKTDEIVVGFDHELMPNFAVGGAYTYRHYKDFYFSYRSNGGVTPTYTFDHNNTGTLPNGAPFSVPIFAIQGAVPPGNYFTARPNYTQVYSGAELTFTKRLSSGWMMRGNLAYNNTKQKVGPGACVDPTNSLYSSGEDSVPGACEDGGIVAPNAGGGSGSFGQVNLNSRWSFNVSGAYQLPLAFTIAANYFGREGYPIAYYVIDNASRDRLSRRAYVTAIDADRYGWVSQLDLRLEKSIPLTSSIAASLAVDFFNVLNLNTVLQRNARLKQGSLSTGTNTITETQAPRILRFSGRLNF
ncbi:MAG: TonB-dependent receptor [Acidobacteriota bacterium]